MKKPDFGMHRETFDPGDGYPPIELECKYVFPGLTFQDLTKLYDDTYKQTEKDDPYCHLAGNPSKWPCCRAMNAVIDAIYKALYDEAG